jgi:hypothetical protein
VATIQAAAVERGAEQYVLALLDENGPDVLTLSDDNFQAVPVGEGYFWIIRPNYGDSQCPCYGLVDEASKVNLNTASQEMLQKLPEMTAELAASIIDWRDTDSDVTAGGAEDEYYLLQASPYHCKNAPFETVDEILLVKGASEDLLYGEDTNLNGLLDPQENDGDVSEPPDNADGKLDRGFYDYVTVYSTEANVDAEGNTRINVSDSAANASSAKRRMVRSG